MMMNRSIKEILGEDDGCMYQYFFHIAPNKASKSETGKEVGETEKLSGKPIKTDNFIIDGKEYDTELINKALKRARILKNAIDKGIITEEEYNQAFDDLAISLERERQEQETEDYYQTITNGLKTWAEKTGESVQLILDRLQDMHEELKELEKEEKIEAQRESIKNDISYLLYPVQRWLEENHPDYVIMISSDHVSVVNRKVTK